MGQLQDMCCVCVGGGLAKQRLCTPYPISLTRTCCQTLWHTLWKMIATHNSASLLLLLLVLVLLLLLLPPVQIVPQLHFHVIPVNTPEDDVSVTHSHARFFSQYLV
mgnify:CR=1 FL=1